MKFNIGDKVKFLNEKGGGVITNIISPTLVSVAIEDGFDMPIMTSDIILSETSDSVGKLFNTKYENQNQHLEYIDNQVSEQFERETPLMKYSSLNKFSTGVYLAFIPQDQVWLVKDKIDIYLINNTNYAILYNFFTISENKTYSGKDYGSISKISKFYIDSITQEQINDWVKGVVQILFHTDRDTKTVQPINCNYSIKPSKFFNKESFLTSSFIAEKSLLVDIGQIIDTPQQITEIEQKFDINKISNSTIEQPKKEKLSIEQFLIDNDTAEIDLHIESLSDNPKELDAIQILVIQLSFFNKYLEQAIKMNLKKVFFIHGVGIGKLKNEITKILSQYPNIHYFDAPNTKYGTGATEVWIKNKE